MYVVTALKGLAIAGLLQALPATAFASIAQVEVDKLSRMCSQAAGEPTTYDLLEGCTCPRGTVFTLAAVANAFDSSPRFAPTCVARKALTSQKHCAGPKAMCYVGADALGAGGQPQGATVSLHSKSPMAQHKARKYSGTAFERWLPAQGFAPLTRYQFGVDFPEFFADLKDQNQLKGALGLQETLLNRHSGSARAGEQVPRRYYAHSEKYLDTVVGISADFNSKGKKEARNLLRLKPWLRPLYIAYVDLLEDRESLKEPKRWQFSRHKGNGCEDACRMVTTRPAVEAHRVSYWQEIIRGKIAKRYLILSSVNSDSQMVLILTPSFVPSMIGEIFYTRTGQDASPMLSENIHLYDLNGVLLANRQAPVYSRSLQQLFNRYKNEPYSLGGDPLIICAGGSGADQFDWLSQELEGGSMLLGPRDSLFGWSPGKYAKPVLAGAARLDFGILSETRLSFAPLRAAVEAARSVATYVQAVPIGSYDCIAHTARWQQTLAATGAKVALLPQPDLLAAGTEACRQQVLDPAAELKDMLWVSAAGNEGRGDYAGSSCLSHEPRPDTLTVAGAVGNDAMVTETTNHGLTTADILAYSGKQDAPEAPYDTAFAAARTAALAATLVRSEQLTGPEARLAVLLGATYDESLAEVTRSSAWLDLDWFFYSSFGKEVR